MTAIREMVQREVHSAIVAQRRVHGEAGEQRSPPSPQGAREVAPCWSWSSAEGCCGEDGAEEGSGDASSPEAEERSAPSQASAWSWASSGLEDKGSVMVKGEEAWTQLATRIPKDLQRPLKLHCVTRDSAVMHFVTEAIEEKLGRTSRRKKRTEDS